MAAPKGSRGRPQTSSVSIAPLSPPQRRNPLLAEKTSYGRKSCSVVASIWRDNVQAAGRAAWGRSCGSAKLVAGTLRCLRLCWGLPWSWSPVKQLGRCPKPHKGAPPLDPARGRRKGTKSPLDPFARLSWSHSHALPACLSSFSLPLIVIGERGEIPPRQLHQFTHRHRAQSLHIDQISSALSSTSAV